MHLAFTVRCMQETSHSDVTAGPQAADANYARIAQAIAFLRSNHARQPDLGELAGHLGLSESHTQRLFTRWAGISPKRFVQYLTVEHAKQRMGVTGNLLGLSLDAGLSGPGRLHDLFVGLEAMTPGEFKRAAEGIGIAYGVGKSPFGTTLIASTARGICHLSFVDGGSSRQLHESLQAQWPAATLRRDDDAAAALLARVFSAAGRVPEGGLSLWVSGTNFQIQVWRALMQVPFAGLLSYRQLAGLIGRPKAARAVGTAVAHNPIAFLIPCHRVLRESGDFGVYHWGSERKVAICAWEGANADRAS